MKPSDVFVFNESIPWEHPAEGIRRKILGFDASLMMVFVEFQKGAVGALHAHVHSQVTYIESGTFSVQIGAEKKTLRSGDCYFIPSNVLHGAVALEKGTLVDVFAPAREDFVPQSADHTVTHKETT